MCLRLDGHDPERVIRIIQTLPGGKSHRVFFLTQYRIISRGYQVNESRDKFVMKDERIVKMKIESKFIDFVYHSKNQDEFLFAMDE